MSNADVRKYVWALTLTSLIAGVGGGLVLQNLLPNYMCSTYYMIPLFFYLVGLVVAFVYIRFKDLSRQKLLMLHSTVRMGKMLLSIVFLLIYCVAQAQHIKEFLVVFIIFYLIFLVFEAIYFFYLEQKRKKEAENRINDNPTK